MRRILSFFALFLFATSVLAADAIRQFPPRTIVALGVRLYQQDKLASDAFDALYTARPEAQKLPMRGWITEYEENSQRVYFLQARDGVHPSVVYTVTFAKNKLPRVDPFDSPDLPDYVAKRYPARQAAIAAIRKFAPGRNYNFEVMEDPEMKGGFLVYALASPYDEDEVVVGGHFRVTISEDGRTVKEVDPLAPDFTALTKRGLVKKDLTPGFLSIVCPLSEAPLESHVYLSILHQTTLMVQTSDNRLWRIEDGKIYRADPKK